MPEPQSPSPIFHIGIVVPDLERAKEQLGRALGLTWGALRNTRYGEWELKAVTSMEGPPYVEVQQGSPGSPWDAQGRSRFDHVQRWSSDIATDRARLTDDDMTVDVGGEEIGQSLFCYLRTADGLRIELIDEEMRPQFHTISKIDGAAQ
jgi:hypothetical protein